MGIKFQKIWSEKKTFNNGIGTENENQNDISEILG